MNVQGFGAGVGKVGRIGSRATGIAAAPCRCCSSPGSTANRTRCGRCSRKTRRAKTDRRFAPVRPRAADAAGRLGQGAVASADAGHPQERWRPARNLRRSHAGRDRRHDAAARARVRRVAQGRLVARRHGAERARPVVHVVVRRVGGTEPRDVQSRAAHREAADARSAVGGDRAGRALRVHARHRAHHRRRARHGRRASRLQRHHVRLLRQVPEGRCERTHREAGPA